MSSRQNPLHLSIVAIVMVIAFGGGLSFSRVLWKSAYSRSNMKPKSIAKQARKWIEELFCRFQVLRQHFIFLSFCIRLHERERERQQASWMPDDMVATGNRAPQVEFPSSVLPVL